MTEKAIPINTGKDRFGFFQSKILFLNVILRLNFTREAEIVTLTGNNCQLPSLFTNFKIRHKNIKIVIFYFTGSLVDIQVFISATSLIVVCIVSMLMNYSPQCR